MTDVCGFADLSDAEKVRFTRAENAATLAYIGDLLVQLDDQTGLPPDRDFSHTEDVTGRLEPRPAIGDRGCRRRLCTSRRRQQPIGSDRSDAAPGTPTA